MTINQQTLHADLQLIKRQSPLVHNITNFVVMNNTANALLAIGASPVMAHAFEEVKDMVAIASALVINMGTLDPIWVDSMLTAGQAASTKGIPVIFDPVGVGATPYRNTAAADIITACKPTIIRGNASEIMALAGESANTKGVDSASTSDIALNGACSLAQQTGAVVVVSGADDYITDGQNVLIISNGSPLMPQVTGMGCTATAITGAFAAVNPDSLTAAAHAMAAMSLAGEIAATRSTGPGSLQMNFIDALYTLIDSDLSGLNVRYETV